MLEPLGLSLRPTAKPIASSNAWHRVSQREIRLASCFIVLFALGLFVLLCISHNPRTAVFDSIALWKFLPERCPRWNTSSLITKLPKPYIFMHVPKSAGTSLAKTIQCLYGVEYQQILRTATYSSLRNGTKALIGHVKFGTHRLFREKGNSTYLVWFRDPIERTISHYYYQRYVMKDRHQMLALRYNLGEWVNNVRHGNNLYTQFLSGIYYKIPDERAFQIAKEKLEKKFKFIGLVSHWNETLVLMKEYLGWPYLPLPPTINTNELMPKNYSMVLDEETLRNVTNANRYDLQLYEIAKTKFQEQINAVGRDYFERELMKLKQQTAVEQQRIWDCCEKLPSPSPSPPPPLRFMPNNQTFAQFLQHRAALMRMSKSPVV